MTPELKAIHTAVTDKLNGLRGHLEAPLDPIQTAHTRGSIFALRAVLDALDPPKSKSVTTQDDPTATAYDT